MGRHPRDHRLGRAAHAFRPVTAHDLVVAADAAGSEDDGLCGQLEVADRVAVGCDAARGVVGSQHDAPHPGARAVGDHQLIDAVAMIEPDQSGGRRRARGVGEGFDDAGASTPGDVETGHRVAVAGGGQIAAFGPADGGQKPDAVAMQPGPFLPGGELDVGAGPFRRPHVLVVEAVESGAALPVVPRQLERVLDPHAALLGAVNEKDASERPVRLPTQVGGILLIHQGDLLAAAGQLMAGHQAS
jgi:hypothetical protein